MSSSGISSSPSFKSAEYLECARIKTKPLKRATHRQEYIDKERLIRETERKNNEVFDDSSTRVFVFKEVSSMDEEESCNLGRRDSWSNKLGLVKKIKLSEDGTALISEPFENFCEIHKHVRKNVARPYSSDTHKVPKPLLQPTAERGIKKQQRPTSTNKLSDIAVSKYPDSIFKVYIPEGNRVIKKKRVIPVVDLKPPTPMRTSKTFAEPTQAQADKPLNPRAVGPPLKTKHSIPQQALQNTDTHKAAGENSESDTQVSKTSVSGNVPKKMTHLTDLSLTKEQEKKRLEEREAMKKRTMDVVKMAFPVTVSEETNPNESGRRGLDSEKSGDECSRSRPSKSKSSLKSFSSGSSCEKAVAGKRSVTWGENDWSDPVQRYGDTKASPRRKKKLLHSHRNMSSSLIGRTDMRNSSRSKLISGSRGLGLKGMAPNLNNREKKKISRPTMNNESYQSAENKKDTYNNRSNRIHDSYSESDQKNESDYEDRCPRERLPKKKHTKDKQLPRRCDCGRILNKSDVESENEIEIRNDKESKEDRSESQKSSCKENADNFQSKRTAIIRKHSTKDALSCTRMNEYVKDQQEKDSVLKSSRNEEDTLLTDMKRGKSIPAIRKIVTTDCSYGSSDSELCFRKDSEKSRVKFFTDQTCEEKPLRKIFESSNSQNEVARNESSAEKITCAKTFSESTNITTTGDTERNNIKDETFTEGYKTSQLKMKLVSEPELGSLQDSELNCLTEEDITRENLTKGEFIINLKTAVELDTEKTADDITSNHCKELMFPGNLDNDYVLVDAYNVVTNSSRTLSGEHSSSVPLIRESPNLNLPYDDTVNDDEGVGKKWELSKKSLKSGTDISNVTKAGSFSSLEHSNPDSQQDYLKNDYSLSFKVKSNFQGPENTRKPALIIQKSMANVVSDSKTSSSTGKFHSKTNPPEMKKSVLRQQAKQALTKNIPEKNPFPQSQNTAEERKLHLHKMLSRGESVGSSKMANQIMEKWNSTQKSISQRKEKMLASIRDTRNVIERAPTQASKEIVYASSIREEKRTAHVPNHQVDQRFQIIQDNEDSYCIKEITIISDNVTMDSSYETQPIEPCEPGNEDDESLISEKEDFETTIIMPGSRIPQPYSSANPSDPSDRRLNESLSPFTNEDAPEKPLCETIDTEIISLTFKNNLPLDVASEKRYVQILDLDKEIPEKDISVSSSVERTTPDIRTVAQSSIPQVGSSQSNTSYNDSSIGSHIHRMTIEDVQSDEHNITPQVTTPSGSPLRNTQEAGLLQKRTVLPKKVSYSRSTSHERSLSRRSKASSSGGARRSVERSVRPPSRKPHLIDDSEEETDQDFVTAPSPFHIDCYRRGTIEPLKKTPTSRMYSTLNHTPHSGQESIKTAIRDLDGVNEDSRSNSVCYDRPMSSGQCSNRGVGYQNSSSRPSSGKQNIPKMSPGSVKILIEKSRNVTPQRSGTPVININRENIQESRKLSPWTQGALRQETVKGPCSPAQNNRRPRTTHMNSTVKNSGNEKPPFRRFARSNYEEEDIWNLQKLKSITVPKTIENYRPPWERVDLTPPESALLERASNERRLGIKSRITVRTSSPQNTGRFTTYQRSSGSATPGCSSPLSVASGGASTPVARRTLIDGKASVGPKIAVGGQTPVGWRTPIGISSPTACRTPVGSRTPVNCRTPVSCRTPISCTTPVNCRTPTGNMSPVVRSRTPIGNRTPNPSERRPVEHKIGTQKSSFPRTDEKLQQGNYLFKKKNENT